MGGKFSVRRAALALGLTLGLAPVEGQAQQTGAAGALTYAAQGWSAADRETFYTTGQGSQLMPYAWFRALKRTDLDEPFAADKLLRYGYLAHDVSSANPEGLPVGFVVDGPVASGELGLTCAACHTGQLEYSHGGVVHALRIDGAPAKTDAQAFLTDLLAAARATLSEPARFDTFAKAVLGAGYTVAKAAQVKDALGKWVAQFGEFMDISLPAASPWGPGRLDAFGMIFNRIAARDLGIRDNYKVADAPVRYPFLWNASRQDRTQWNGGVQNGLFIQALGRNTGEVLGVFADFAPHRLFPPTPLAPAIIDFKTNSINFAGLQTLEEKIAVLRPPPWPREIFGLDEPLAAKGKPLFDANCGGCHAVQASLDLPGLWRTPVLAVGTDPKMLMNSQRTAEPGLLLGALMPPPAIGARISDPAKAGDLLATAVVGTLLAEAFIPPIPSPTKLTQSGVFRALRKDFAERFPAENLDTLLDPRLLPKAKLDALVELKAFIDARLSNMFSPPPAIAGAAYESRVLDGVWAVAPYLHNGSVPNLWELMKLAKDRKSSFMVGSRVFDPKNVGYAVDESPFKSGAFLADPANANGNGNGGHEFGAGLTDDERWAIIEYMKTF
ncbi:MAG: di-heme-cytochrome C peroxidase [Roseiarcus sp.]